MPQAARARQSHLNVEVMPVFYAQYLVSREIMDLIMVVLRKITCKVGGSVADTRMHIAATISLLHVKAYLWRTPGLRPCQ